MFRSQVSSANPLPGLSRGYIAAFITHDPHLWLALLAFVAGLWPQALMNDSDTLWHLSAGQYMLEHQQILAHDPFSFSVYGKPWHTHEWLGEGLMSWIHGVSGWPGLMALAATSLGATVLICARYAQSRLSGLTLGVSLLVGLSLIGPHYLIRPHLFVLPLLVGLLSGLMRARETNASPPLGLALVFLPWANMHASFIFGLLLIGFFALEAVVAAKGAERLEAARSWGLMLTLSGLVCMITPQGLEGFVFPFRLIFMPGIDGIAEWGPADLTRPTPLLIALLVWAYGMLRFRIKVPVWRGGLLLVLTGLSLAHIRYEMILGVVALFILSGPLAEALASIRSPAAGYGPAGKAATPFKAIVAFACAALAVLALRLNIPAPPPSTALHPREALASVPRALQAQPVLNDYDFGGFLIAEGVRPFVDGRADMYGADFLKTYDGIMAADARDLGHALDERAIQWSLLKRRSHAAAEIDHLPGWHRLYADADVVIQARIQPNDARPDLPPLSPLWQR